MKVMTAMYTMKRGGSYDRFIMMLEAFLERGCAVHCLSLTEIRIENPRFYNHILFYPFGNKENSMAKLTVLFFFPLWSVWIGWRHKIDLIIAFGSLYGFLLSFSKWLLQKPMATFIRGNYAFGLRTQNSSSILVLLNKMIEYYGLLFSDKIIINNSAARDEMLKRLGKIRNIDVQVLYNNIPPMSIREKESVLQTRDKYGISVNAKVLVTAAVLTRGKNIETLIKCLPKIEEKDLYALIVGDGSTEADIFYRNYLKELAKTLQVSKQVLFVGWLDKEELWKIYLASDLFVLPSLSEGMPNAMLEALGAGLPCIGSNIAGVKDILQYDELLFDPLDEKALTQKIDRVFSDSQFLDRIKRLCQERKKVFEFDWKERVFQIVTMGLDHAHCKL
jgi:glycosyltransferase involved in cell wall biosynthesis